MPGNEPARNDYLCEVLILKNNREHLLTAEPRKSEVRDNDVYTVLVQGCETLQFV